jgi:hypothetical protein
MPAFEFAVRGRHLLAGARRTVAKVPVTNTTIGRALLS